MKSQDTIARRDLLKKLAISAAVGGMTSTPGAAVRASIEIQ